jgi:formate--tetrahydrofolate ligase
MKGGAAGGGWAQVVPMEDINLHFTGDFHAVSAANNLLAALIDNHIQQGNALKIDPRAVTWRRCVDMNDRQLRNIVSGLGGHADGTPREDGFDITAASEVMAILCLSGSVSDMKERFSRIVVGYTYDGEPVTAGALHAAGAMCALMRDAIKPNLVQTLEGTPALVHGGPFANIAHGCNSVTATKMALKLGDYAITEAGFGADLGAEKFLDIKCRAAGLAPAAVVVVATVRALKHHGGAGKKNSKLSPTEQLERGIPNLTRHVANIRDVFGLHCVVAINRFPDDTDEELSFVESACAKAGAKAVVSSVWAEGGKGGEDLAREVVRLCDEPSDFRFCYDAELSISEKLQAIASRVYGARGVAFAPEAKRMEKKLAESGFGNLPVCVAKTQYSFSDDPKRLGAPEDFEITVRALRVSAGAGFVVALTGDIMTMPGLPKAPAAELIDIDADGRISGLF